MTRSVPEWIGKDANTPVPPRVRLRVFDRFGGRCGCGCGRKIASGEKWQADHIVAIINGGENRETNLRPLLTEHHKEKTAQDVAEKSRTYATRSRHVGINRSGRGFLTNKTGPFKKKLDGTVERRR